MTLTVRKACELIDSQLAADQPLPGATAGWRRELTVREIQIVMGLCDGLTRAAIARRAGISEATVATHLHRINRVVGATNQAGIVAACFRAGVIS